jgi:proteasome lid subunit RPN8/RPN11
MRISARLLDEIAAHARDDAPNECCGLVSGRDGHPLQVRRAENLFASPTRFEVADLARMLRNIDEGGEELIAMYHSHPRTAAYPSETDKNLAAGWPGVVWLICSLEGEEPETRAFLIESGQERELPLEIDGN